MILFTNCRCLKYYVALDIYIYHFFHLVFVLDLLTEGSRVWVEIRWPLLAPLCLSWHCWTIVSHPRRGAGVPLLQLSSNFPYFPSQQFGVSKWLLPRVQPDLGQVASHTPQSGHPQTDDLSGGEATRNLEHFCGESSRKLLKCADNKELSGDRPHPREAGREIVEEETRHAKSKSCSSHERRH